MTDSRRESWRAHVERLPVRPWERGTVVARLHPAEPRAYLPPQPAHLRGERRS